MWPMAGRTRRCSRSYSLADKAQQLSAEFNLPRKAAIRTVVAHVAAELLMVDELDGRSLSSQIDSLYCTTAPS